MSLPIVTHDISHKWQLYHHDSRHVTPAGCLANLSVAGTPRMLHQHHKRRYSMNCSNCYTAVQQSTTWCTTAAVSKLVADRSDSLQGWLTLPCQMRISMHAPSLGSGPDDTDTRGGHVEYMYRHQTPLVKPHCTTSQHSADS
jgi:hypothetical protein